MLCGVHVIRYNGKALLIKPVHPPITGSELRHHRQNSGLSQIALAEQAGVSRDTVQYWEAKPVVDVRGWGPEHILKALGLRVYQTSNAHARSRGISASRQKMIDQELTAERLRSKQIQEKAGSKHRVLCEAKTRKGTPCQRKSEPGRKRCKLHGGMSTGPITAEGRKRIADAQRSRWARRSKKASRQP